MPAGAGPTPRATKGWAGASPPTNASPRLSSRLSDARPPPCRVLPGHSSDAGEGEVEGVHETRLGRRHREKPLSRLPERDRIGVEHGAVSYTHLRAHETR